MVKIWKRPWKFIPQFLDTMTELNKYLSLGESVGFTGGHKILIPNIC